MLLHLDIDCFFASAHRINTPNLENIPIAVGGRSNLSLFDKQKHTQQMSKIKGAFTSAIVTKAKDTFQEYFVDKNGKTRGIITTCSYEARKFGVKTAMSVSQSIALCPHLLVIPPNYPLYHELSYKLKILLEKEIPLVQQFSIDEFFADMSGWISDDDAYDFCLNLKKKIKKELGLPVSIGIAKTKWIAKLATNEAKPYGVLQIKENEVDDFIEHKPVKDFCGVGIGYQRKLNENGIRFLGQVKKNEKLFSSWGKSGKDLYKRITGTDTEKIITIITPSKSLGLGRTFDPEINRDEIKRRITILCRHLSFLAYKNGKHPMTSSLNIRYEYGLSEKYSINENRQFSEKLLKKQTIAMFDKIDTHKNYCVIQISITLSNFQEQNNTTLNLFTQKEDEKEVNITKHMHALRDKFGVDIIKHAWELS